MEGYGCQAHGPVKMGMDAYRVTGIPQLPMLSIRLLRVPEAYLASIAGMRVNTSLKSVGSSCIPRLAACWFMSVHGHPTESD